MKKTALYNIHSNLGAKIIPFAAYEMPVSYSSIKEEHLCVRNSVGVFDVSHMGEFILKGEKVLDLLLKIATNDASILSNGKAQYTCMTNTNGGIIDDMIIYKKYETEYLVVVNASNIEKDWSWIKENNTFGVEMTDVSDSTGLLAIQGPKACEAMQSLTDINLSKMEFYTHQTATFAGVENVLIATTGYTGSGGIEIYAPANKMVEIWNKIFEAGKLYNIKPIGLAARDTLRLEKGFCLYGNDIDDNTNPIEAGLAWITKMNHDFTASDIIKKVKEEKIKRRLVGFKLIDRGIPRQGYPIVDAEGNEIGIVTSGTQSPSLSEAIGMGYVSILFRKPGSEIYIQIRKKRVKAIVSKMPFL
ncbi:MAG: glycine cleavage system aminomethyltransferase GcvT [Methanosarcinales archaeon]|nr:glycine cleavage system aminomethyltransferase GcvT [Methanosarcinales archaeon]